MVTGDRHSFLHVEAMGVKSLDAAVQMQLCAANFTGIRDEPIEQLFAKMFRAFAGEGYEVVDIHVISPCQRLEDAKASDGTEYFIFLQVHKPIA